MSKQETENSPAEISAIEWLSKLRSSELSKEQHDQFFFWLQESSEHQEAFVKADKLWQSGEVLSRVKREEKSSWNTDFLPNFSPWYGYGIAATSIFCLMMIFLLPARQLDSQTFYSYDSPRENIELDDGSFIKLNVNSQAIVSVSDRTGRNVELVKGEVYFDVVSDPKRPFTIHTGDGDIVVLGTQFSVRKELKETQVVVVEGRVSVEPVKKVDSALNQLRILGPDQQITLGSGDMVVEPVDANRVLAWRKGLLKFDGNPLSEVVEALNRYYSGRVEIGDHSLNNLKVVAVLSLQQELDSNLALLEANLQLLVVEDPQTNITRLYRDD